MTKASKAGVKHYASGNTHVPETSQEELNRGVGGPPLHMKFSRDAALSRIPAPHLLKQEQLQLAGASFRDEHRCVLKFVNHADALRNSTCLFH